MAQLTVLFFGLFQLASSQIYQQLNPNIYARKGEPLSNSAPLQVDETNDPLPSHLATGPNKDHKLNHFDKEEEMVLFLDEPFADQAQDHLVAELIKDFRTFGGTSGKIRKIPNSEYSAADRKALSLEDTAFELLEESAEIPEATKIQAVLKDSKSEEKSVFKTVKNTATRIPFNQQSALVRRKNRLHEVIRASSNITVAQTTTTTTPKPTTESSSREITQEDIELKKTTLVSDFPLFDEDDYDYEYEQATSTDSFSYPGYISKEVGQQLSRQGSPSFSGSFSPIFYSNGYALAPPAPLPSFSPPEEFVIPPSNPYLSPPAAVPPGEPFQFSAPQVNGHVALPPGPTSLIQPDLPSDFDPVGLPRRVPDSSLSNTSPRFSAPSNEEFEEYNYETDYAEQPKSPPQSLFSVPIQTTPTFNYTTFANAFAEALAQHPFFGKQLQNPQELAQDSLAKSTFKYPFNDTTGLIEALSRNTAAFLPLETPLSWIRAAEKANQENPWYHHLAESAQSVDKGGPHLLVEDLDPSPQQFADDFITSPPPIDDNIHNYDQYLAASSYDTTVDSDDFNEQLLQAQKELWNPSVALPTGQIPADVHPPALAVSQEFYENSPDYYSFNQPAEPQSLPVPPYNPICSRADPLDLVMVIDGSGSINDEQFQQVRNFMAQMVNIVPVGTQVSAVQFSTGPRSEFSLNQYSERRKIIDHINNMAQLSGSTSIGAALEYVFRSQLVPAAGDRINVPNAILVITDGISDDDPLPAANAIRQTGTRTISIGVSDSVNAAQLLAIAGEPKRVFQIPSFSHLDKHLGNVVFQELFCPFDPLSDTNPILPSRPPAPRAEADNLVSINDENLLTSDTFDTLPDFSKEHASPEEQQKQHFLCCFWASTGACSRNPEFMDENCNSACSGNCGCRDEHPLCEFWANRQRCQTAPISMFYICRKACQLC